MSKKSKIEQLSELPRPDNKVVIGVLAAGLAFWEWKKRQDRSNDSDDEHPAVDRPLIMALKERVLSIYPSSKHHEDGRPKAVTVGVVTGPEGSVAVSGEVDEEGAIIPEQNSEIDPDKLDVLREAIEEARQSAEAPGSLNGK